jgi:uncharacterized protein YdeI (YjbR/CyaY-like superfamily)
MQKPKTEIFYAKNATEWREWLEKNHSSSLSVWLVLFNKKSSNVSITWREAVDVALCFGWIDSKKISIDSETSHQFFSKRKAKSTWSKINKQIIESLIQQGFMREAGFKSIEIAKENGSWTFLDEIEELIVPPDLKSELENNAVAVEYFESLSKSVKKAILYWLKSAQRPETRKKRLTEIVERAAVRERPNKL